MGEARGRRYEGSAVHNIADGSGPNSEVIDICQEQFRCSSRDETYLRGLPRKKGKK
jgi:hypothetical protein